MWLFDQNGCRLASWPKNPHWVYHTNQVLNVLSHGPAFQLLSLCWRLCWNWLPVKLPQNARMWIQQPAPRRWPAHQQCVRMQHCPLPVRDSVVFVVSSLLRHSNRLIVCMYMYSTTCGFLGCNTDLCWLLEKYIILYCSDLIGIMIASLNCKES